jgi:hypothetical protein
MKRLAIALFFLLAASPLLWLAAAPSPPSTPSTGRATPAPSFHLELPAAQGALRFLPVDILLDTGNKPLGAYQLEIRARNATFVGLEGGDPASFKNAPYYDPAALQAGAAGGGGMGGGAAEGRIIVAAFSTDDVQKLPTGASRVARLHLAVAGAAADKPDLTTTLVVATDGQGQTIDTQLKLQLPDALQGETR